MNNTKNWQSKITLKNTDSIQRLATQISQNFSISEILAHLLALRGVKFEEVATFLEPKIKNTLPDPFGLGDMKLAIDYLIAAILSQKKIAIFGDYDVDGGTSCALFKRYFAALEISVEIYIPDRLKEGYGPNSKALLNLKKKGIDLVIMVDCGTVAFAPLETAKKAGLDIVVIDHHLGVLEKPEAIAVINPNLLGETFPHKNLCAAAVSFLFLVALSSELRKKDFFKKKTEPNLFNLLDLVALGTVCDVMPLTGLNRSLVCAGLKILNKKQNLGLKTILEKSGLNGEVSAYSLGFVIGPRINAGGRVGKSDLGAKILACEDELEATKIADQLEELNAQRKEIEAAVLQHAIQQLESEGSDEKALSKNIFRATDPVIFACSAGWHPGVIGIVASRLKERYSKPVAVISIDDEKMIGKASCRSIAGIDFGNEILKARLSGLLIEGGGHAMAGGFLVTSDKVAELHRFFCKNLGEKVLESLKNQVFAYDLELDIAQINLDLLHEISRLEPFGQGNLRPRFLVKDAYKIKASLIGKNQEHLSCLFAPKSAIGFGTAIQAIAFKATESDLAEKILSWPANKSLSLICNLEINSWMGVEKPKIFLEDVVFESS